jgi:hypothetical protein
MDINLNQNIDQKTLEACLKEVSNIGSTVYQNICTGTSSIVIWGGLDWVAGIILVLIGITVCGIIVTGLFKLIFDSYY